METVRLTVAQALIRHLMAQETEIDGARAPLFAGMWAIFGHGNVAAMGEALHAVRERFPTWRAQNEQGMAHAAVAFAKATNRRRIMACTSSIGPGATNMVTAAAVAHVDRLPVLLLPGDVFADRRPDPVLQQIENFGDPTISANDCFKPVSRYWDRITRAEQLLTSLPRAIAVMTDPADCGPATLCLSQDVQAEAYDFPLDFFAPRLHRQRRPAPDAVELADAVARLKGARRPLIIAGGGVHYADATQALKSFAERHGVPVAETQAGKGALPFDHPWTVGSIGVTGSSAANDLARDADVVLAVGTRLQDFTTASRSLFQGALIQLNVASFDAAKHRAMPLVADARRGLEDLSQALDGYASPAEWRDRVTTGMVAWNNVVDRVTAASDSNLPSDMQVIGAVNRKSGPRDVVVGAAGGLPGELHKLWRTRDPKGYHLEYGFSCMGYEIAGGLGVKLACPDREIYVMVGDGSYMMMNSELATAVLLRQKLIVVLLDNRGYGCINRLQNATGGASFNNLFDTIEGGAALRIDFAAHAASMGAHAESVGSIAELEAALDRAAARDETSLIAIRTDAVATTPEGGAWWDVAVPEISIRPSVTAARENYVSARIQQSRG